MKDFKVIELVLDEENEISGIQAISIVDDPAIEEEVRYCKSPKHKEKVRLKLKSGRYGPFYSCSEWKRDKTGCNYREKV